MKSQASNPNTLNHFKEFVDEHSPDEAMEIERMWKKKLENQKSKNYTKAMIAAVVIMVIIFAVLISFIGQGDNKKHAELQEVSFMDTDYTYLQSSYPHLKFLVPHEDTKEIRLLKALGIIYPQLIAWLEANLTPNLRVLLIPNENTRVNILGMAIGYYLKQSSGGSLTIGLTGIKYSQMTTKNIELMNNELPQPMPIKLIFLNEYEGADYDLIVLQNSSFHQKLEKTTSAKIIMIRRQAKETSIMDSIFLGHAKFEIIKGKTSAEVRNFPLLYGYAIVPYVPSQKMDNNYILLLPHPVGDVELCQEQNPAFLKESGVRNLLQHLKNQTFADTSVYYGIDSLAGLQAISQFPTLETLYTSINTQAVSNVTYLSTPSKMKRSKRNVYILAYQSKIGLSIEKGDELYIYVANQTERKEIKSSLSSKGEKLSVLSPYNNKGCYYPPVLADYSSALILNQPFFILVQHNQPGATSPEN